MEFYGILLNFQHMMTIGLGDFFCGKKKTYQSFMLTLFLSIGLSFFLSGLS